MFDWPVDYSLLFVPCMPPTTPGTTPYHTKKGQQPNALAHKSVSDYTKKGNNPTPQHTKVCQIVLQKVPDYAGLVNIS